MSRVDDILAQIDLRSILPPDLPLRDVGRDRWRGKCPIQEHRSAAFSLARHPAGHLVFQCFACNLRGSVIDLYAAMEGVTMRDAIRKLSEKNCAPLSKDAILRRAYDAIERTYPEFGYLLCDVDSCSTVEPLASELDFAILRSGSSWLWKVSPNGSKAICHKHQW